jgi:hypothetical protein
MAIVHFDTLRSVSSGSITNSYTDLGSIIDQNWRMFRIVNNTDGDMLFTTDGTNDQLFVPSYSFLLYDMATNALNVSDSDWFVLPMNTQFSLKYSTAPSTGSVYLEGVFSTGV